MYLPFQKSLSVNFSRKFENLTDGDFLHIFFFFLKIPIMGLSVFSTYKVQTCFRYRRIHIKIRLLDKPQSLWARSDVRHAPRISLGRWAWLSTS